MIDVAFIRNLYIVVAYLCVVAHVYMRLDNIIILRITI